MRRSYVEQPSRHNQRGASFLSKEKKRNPPSTSNNSDHVAKKAEGGSETIKKLERKPSEDINASADAFIKNFRKQLIIQRLQSIENYEQMLARGL